MASACEMSISRIVACACGLRTVCPQSIPAALRSLAYANSPVVFGAASGRVIDSPTRPSWSLRTAELTPDSPQKDTQKPHPGWG